MEIAKNGLVREREKKKCKKGSNIDFTFNRKKWTNEMSFLYSTVQENGK